jgi:hypothetical protein
MLQVPCSGTGERHPGSEEHSGLPSMQMQDAHWTQSGCIILAYLLHQALRRFVATQHQISNRGGRIKSYRSEAMTIIVL